MVNVRKRIREGEFWRRLMVGHDLDHVRTEPTTRLFIEANYLVNYIVSL